MGLNKRLTNGNGTHWNSEAGREAVKYRDIFNITLLDGKKCPEHFLTAWLAACRQVSGMIRVKMAPARRVEAKNPHSALLSTCLDG
ncbi:hypothetical protein GCM10027098_12050 [Bowmanella dokdonensis]